MAWYPMATRREITKHRTAMVAHRRFTLHTAVSSAASLFGWHQQVSHCSHFYITASGHVEQYVDTRLQAPNQMQGNPDTISVETQDMGGPFPAWSGSNVPAWTPQQVEAIAQLAVWVHQTHGIPLTQLPSSKPGTRGIGWHRQGIDGNFPSGILAGRVAGGETWSQPGKVCPGDRRIKQIPGIIARANQIVKGDPMELSKAGLEAVGNVTWNGRENPTLEMVYGKILRLIFNAVRPDLQQTPGARLGFLRDLDRMQDKQDAILDAVAGVDSADIKRHIDTRHAEALAAVARVEAMLDTLPATLAAELPEVPVEVLEAALRRALSRVRLAVDEDQPGGND